MERLWNKISSSINQIFFNRRLRKNLEIANKMLPLINEYLSNHNYKFTSKIDFDNWQRDWPKLDIEIKIAVANYKVVLKVWEEVDAYIYPMFNINEYHDVFIHFDLLE
jgi:hypothetical protein